jgi:hypothetical protein
LYRIKTVSILDLVIPVAAVKVVREYIYGMKKFNGQPV